MLFICAIVFTLKKEVTADVLFFRALVLCTSVENNVVYQSTDVTYLFTVINLKLWLIFISTYDPIPYYSRIVYHYCCLNSLDFFWEVYINYASKMALFTPEHGNSHYLVFKIKVSIVVSRRSETSVTSHGR